VNRLIPRLSVALALSGAAVLISASTASAGECDLYLSTSSCTFATDTGGSNSPDVLFMVDTSHPTGTGFIDSFLRVQQKYFEQGYNLSDRPVQFDEKTDPNFTRDLTYSEAAVVNGYRAFLLDINEPDAGAKGNITLDQLEIYVSPNPIDVAGATNTDYSTSGGGSLAGATKIYDMDATDDNFINLSYGLNGGGSGTGDMIVWIPNSFFLSGNNYITLYSQFGCAVRNNQNACNGADSKKFASEAGFEEWWALTPLTVTTHSAVPEPTSMLLLGTGVAALVSRRRRRTNR